VKAARAEWKENEGLFIDTEFKSGKTKKFLGMVVVMWEY
jgi:hypothetical protein